MEASQLSCLRTLLSVKWKGPLPSNRRHLSCDDCLEDKREDYQNCYFSAVLCTTIVHSHKHTHMSSSYRCTRKCWFRFNLGYFVCFACFSYLGSVCFMVSFCVFLVYFLLFVSSCQYQCKWLPGKTRLRNDRLCVERDVNSLNITWKDKVMNETARKRMG